MGGFLPNFISVTCKRTIRKRTLLLNGSYNPNKSQVSHHLECLNQLLDEYIKDAINHFKQFVENCAAS